MDSQVQHQTNAAPPHHPAGSRPTLIAVPFFRNEQLVATLVQSLIACANDIHAINGRVVFYNDSPDYPPLAQALATILPRAAAAFPCALHTNNANLGFVRTMNRAVAAAVDSGLNLLLLNSDTRICPGALPDMLRVLTADPSTAFVNPRSNNATIATLPIAHRFEGASEKEQLAAYQAFAAILPDRTYVPTAVGFCMLVAWHILAEFGGFDEIYGQGYNEENDLVMRAARCGYRAALANKAFVWHDGEASFATANVTRDTLEITNRAILDRRYPEYATHTAAHNNAPETIAERLLAMMIPDARGRVDIALDFSSFREAHNGTFQAGRQLLQAAAKAWSDRYNVHVICVEGVYDFHQYGKLGVPRCDPQSGRQFAAVFRVGQPYDWNAVQRLCMGGAAIGIYMLDTISIDCPQLASPRLYNMWQFTLDHVDLLATQSRHTARQFADRFRLSPGALNIVSLHSLELDDYRLETTGADAQNGAGVLLVLGNHFHHKYLSHTANALAVAFPNRTIVALGHEKSGPSDRVDPMAPPPLQDLPNLDGVRVGNLDDAAIGQLYESSDAVIFPSHAEGFGFPALNALAARRPVFVRRLPVFLELWEHLDRTPNIHFFESTKELVEQLRILPHWLDIEPRPVQEDDTQRSAREILVGLERAMHLVLYDRLVVRVRALQFASDIGNPDVSLAPGQGVRVEAARLVADSVERVVRAAFRITPIYLLFRTCFRIARAVRQRPGALPLDPAGG
jgi:GT2 family glycosyltransferase